MKHYADYLTLKPLSQKITHKKSYSALQSKIKLQAQMIEKIEKLERVKDIIENILYWDTCPEEYKLRLAEAFSIEKER